MSRFLNVNRRTHAGSSRSPSPQGRGRAAATADLAARVHRFNLSAEEDAAARVTEEDNQSFTTADGGVVEAEGESTCINFFLFGDASSRGGGSTIVRVDEVTGGVASLGWFRYIDDDLHISSTHHGVEGSIRQRSRDIGLRGHFWRRPHVLMGNPGVTPSSAIRFAQPPNNSLRETVADMESRGFLRRVPSSSINLDLRGRWTRRELGADNHSSLALSNETEEHRGRSAANARRRMDEIREELVRLRRSGNRMPPVPRGNGDLRRVYDGRYPNGEDEEQSEWRRAPVALPPAPWPRALISFAVPNPQEGEGWPR